MCVCTSFTPDGAQVLVTSIMQPNYRARGMQETPTDREQGPAEWHYSETCYANEPRAAIYRCAS